MPGVIVKYFTLKIRKKQILIINLGLAPGTKPKDLRANLSILIYVLTERPLDN
jgi:hypothetical protein